MVEEQQTIIKLALARILPSNQHNSIYFCEVRYYCLDLESKRKMN
jgi:hypothetical protein